MILYPPKSKNNRNLIGKENMVDPKVFERLGPYEFLFLNKRIKAKRMQILLHEEIAVEMN